MKQPFRSASVGVAMTLVLGMFAILSSGCGTIDATGFLELEICDILNCDGLFFRNLVDGHDDMAGMDGMDDADAHDDDGDDHIDGVDDHDDDGDDDHMDDMGDTTTAMTTTWTTWMNMTTTMQRKRNTTMQPRAMTEAHQA